MLWPKEAGKFIASRAKDVYISQESVKSCAKAIVEAAKKDKLTVDAFKQNEVLPLDLGLSIDQLVDWTFCVDAINFSFWTKKGDPKFKVTHKGKTRTGYLAMVSAVNRAIEEGKPMYDPKYYSRLTIDDAKHIFRASSTSAIPLLEERIRVLNEIGNILMQKFDGSFNTVLKSAENNAMKLVDSVQKEFPCFHDVHTYEGESVAILKRAQILAADLALLFKLKGLPDLVDQDKLTMFADYRVPQSLVHYGVMSYSENLMEKLRNEHLFTCGDREEVEIRGVSIHAVELIVEQAQRILKERGITQCHINSARVDYYLWDFRIANAQELEKIPYHKTRCIYY